MGHIGSRRRVLAALSLACLAGGSMVLAPRLVDRQPSFGSVLSPGAFGHARVRPLAVPGRPDGQLVPLFTTSGSLNTGALVAGGSSLVAGAKASPMLASPEPGVTETLAAWPKGQVSLGAVVVPGGFRGHDTEIDPHAMATLVAMATINGSVRTIDFPISFASATLSSVGPASPATPIRPDQAFLAVNMSASVGDADGTQVEPYAALPGSNVSLRLSDGTALHPVSSDGESLPTLLSPTYTFVVPARLGDAQLVIAPNQVAAQYLDSSATFKPVTLTFTAPAIFNLGFPPSGGAANGQPKGGGPPTAHAKRAGEFPLVIVIVIVGAVIAAGVGVETARRRKHWLPARPVRTSQAALLALTDAERTRLAAPRPPPALEAPPAMLSPWVPRPDYTATTETPAAPPDTHSDAAAREPVMIIRILGPLDVEGLTHTVRRRSALRLLVCLAIHAEREVSVEELRDGIATKTDAPPATATVHSIASTLRNRHLPSGLLPPIGPGSNGYRLSTGVEVDWSMFQALSARADTLDGAARLELLSRALRLVRGAPLAHSLWQGVTRACQQMETEIETTAADAARLALELRDARGAEWAISQGVRAVGDSVVLWELRLVAAAAGSGHGLERAWRDAQERLGADASMLAATYQRLASGAF